MAAKGNSGMPLFTALREGLRAGYRLETLRGDLLAGITVGIIAIPLAMALAIAVGVDPVGRSCGMVSRAFRLMRSVGHRIDICNKKLTLMC